jgi:hypothetical protein
MKYSPPPVKRARRQQHADVDADLLRLPYPIFARERSIIASDPNNYEVARFVTRHTS